jgi:16S rRNA (cytidine1402-2'-O)-methyltransferase
MPDRQIAVCREITKIYESVIRGTATEVLQHFMQNPGEVRGEFVVVVAA